MHMTFFFVGEMFFVGEAVFLLLEICFFVGEAAFLLLKRQFVCWRSGDCFGWRSAFLVVEAGKFSDEVLDNKLTKPWTTYISLHQIC